MRKWCDGYHFGDADVYCPWDVMCYVDDLQSDPDAKPDEYWKDTSDNAIICSFIDYAGASITKKLDDLEPECTKALQQIDARMYARDFEDEYDSEHIHCYGIAFYSIRNAVW